MREKREREVDEEEKTIKGKRRKREERKGHSLEKKRK
jgi:hypothetical protein